MKLTHLARAAVGIALLGAASLASAAPLYRVSATVTYADGPALRPVMLVEADSHASMSIGGEPQYEWGVQLSEIDAERNHATIRTDLRIAEEHWDPSIRVVMGKPATLSIGEMHMELLVEAHNQPQTARN